MRTLLYLFVLACLLGLAQAGCKSSCVPYVEGAKGSMDKSEYEYRERVFQCLFDKADKQKKGYVTGDDYAAWKGKYLPWNYRWLAPWSAVSFMCNCDCDKESITWEDIHGSSSACLSRPADIDFAYQLLCK